MNTRQAAEAMGTTPKILRQFLRADKRYANVGSSGRYTFTPRQVAGMKKHFAEWVGGRALVTTQPDTDGRRPLPMSMLTRNDRAARARFDAETQARLANLHRAMREAGLTRNPTRVD